MSTYFSYYYFSIQAGAVGATVGIPICLTYLPPYQSFTILIAALIIAVMVFSAPSYYYYHKPIGTSTFANAVKIVWVCYILFFIVCGSCFSFFFFALRGFRLHSFSIFFD
jgi:hypothetical protein